MPEPVKQFPDDLQQRFDYTTTASTWYIGVSSPGALETDPVWKVVRHSLDTSGRTTSTQFADGNANFDNRWSQRASLTYGA